MAESEKVILTNMCMVYNGNKVLVQDRLNRNWKGLAFPGGHVEKHESFTDAVIREVKEETGLTISSPQLCHKSVAKDICFYISYAHVVKVFGFLNGVDCK